MNPQPPGTTIFIESSPAATTPSARILVRTGVDRDPAELPGPCLITFCTAGTAGRGSGVRWQLIAEQAVAALATRGPNATASTPRGSQASFECASQQSCADLRPCCADASDQRIEWVPSRGALQPTTLLLIFCKSDLAIVPQRRQHLQEKPIHWDEYPRHAFPLIRLPSELRKSA